jgi:hypothetical protein
VNDAELASTIHLLPGNAGVAYAGADALCQQFGLRLANVTQGDLAGLLAFLPSCFDNNALVDTFIGTYESLPSAPGGCQALSPLTGVVLSETSECPGPLPVLCAIGANLVNLTFATTTLTHAVTETEMDTETVSKLSVSTLTTEYWLSDVVTSLTLNSSTVVTVPTTLPCPAVTRTILGPHCPCPADYYESGSAEAGCECLPRQTRPKAVQSSFTTCTTSWAGFVVVQNQEPDNETPLTACAVYDLSVANLTQQLMPGITQLLTSCSVSSAAFGSWYAYEPGCAYVSATGGWVFYDTPLEGSLACINATYVLCRSGPPLVTTSTVTTGPVGTDSLTSLQRTWTYTVVSTTTTTVSTETVTNWTSLTESIFIPTTETDTDVEVSTSTALTTRTLSCCCPPAVCTTLPACCPDCH